MVRGEKIQQASFDLSSQVVGRAVGDADPESTMPCASRRVSRRCEARRVPLALRCLVMFARSLSVAVLGVFGFAVAGASGSGTKTITVGAGDSVAIRGSDLECVVSTTVPRSIVCAIGSKRSLRPHTYAITVADKGAAVFVATGSQQVVARALNPAISGASIKGANHKPASHVLANGEGVLVTGTHVECGSARINNNKLETIGCGIYNASSGRYYVAGTYAATIDDKYAGILRAGKNGAQTVVAVKKQT
jgi:hypothetical protein